MPSLRSQRAFRPAFDRYFDHVLETAVGLDTMSDRCDLPPVRRPRRPALKEIPEIAFPAPTCGDLSLFRTVRICNHQCAFCFSAAHKGYLLAVRRETNRTANVFDHFSGSAAQN